MCEEDDPVVSEMDMFLATDMRSKSFVLQFPLVSRKQGCPNIQQISMDKDTKQYKIVVEPPDDALSASSLTPHPLQTYKISTPQSYAVGLIVDNQLHLTPIPQILQARPSDINEDESKEKNKNEDEKYVALDFTETSETKSYQTAATTDIASPITAAMYKDNLTGMHCDFTSDLLDQITDNTLSTRPPREQMYYFLMMERTISFSDAINKLSLIAYSNDLIDIVMKYAYYVQGRWVAKSEELSTKEFPVNLRLPRNVAICVFANKKHFPREASKAFAHRFNLTSSDMSKIFNRLGTNKDKQLIFKFKENTEFETMHREKVVEAMKEVKKLMKSIILLRGKEVFEGVGFTDEELA